MADTRNYVLNSYYELHAAEAARDVYEDITLAWPYYDANYSQFIERLRTDARILEVGPGHGSFVAWLVARGFDHVEAVDLSPANVDLANARLDRTRIIAGEAHAYLNSHPQAYDLIVMKAVLEHIPHEQLVDTVAVIARSLRTDGAAVLEVPNMDWILAAHERYMDLTHTTGFTPESLRALLRTAFVDVEVKGSVLAQPTRSQRLLRRPLLWALRKSLYVMGEGASDLLFAHRSLLARVRGIVAA